MGVRFSHGLHFTYLFIEVGFLGYIDKIDKLCQCANAETYQPKQIQAVHIFVNTVTKLMLQSNLMNI